MPDEITRADVQRARALARRRRFDAHAAALAAQAGPMYGGGFQMEALQRQDGDILSEADRNWLLSLVAKLEALLPAEDATAMLAPPA